ncbi:MAG: hypothetical protein NT061_05975 [Spirochaetes bacterium]|nr:hypothetical protein [Spirochaetota bacterium]
MTSQPTTAKVGFFESGAGKILARNWASCFLILMIAIFSLAGPGFFDIVNFQNIIHLSTGAFLVAAA